MKFTPLQTLVANHYSGGEFSNLNNTRESDDCGDTLFTYCINEAGQAEPEVGVLRSFLGIAIAELTLLREALK